MELFYRKYGTPPAPPLIILHGLLGSSANWHDLAQRLCGKLTIYALDLRNHGRSPHGDRQSYEAMCLDVKNWCDKMGLLEIFLMGHSMGGKVAMKLACGHPDLVRRLLVVDVKPLPILRDLPVLSAMAALDLSSVKDLADGESKLADLGLGPELSRFAATNLVKSGEGYAWRVNLPVFREYESHIMRTGLSAEEKYNGPTDFLLGEKSGVVSPEEYPKIKNHFPRATFTLIPGSGHNPHIEAPEALAKKVLECLNP